MPNYESSGAENLRADAHVYTGEATSKVKSGGSKSTPKGSGDKTPKGVQTFSDEGV
jgi:hypothetical protein